LYVNPKQECHLDAQLWFLLMLDTQDKLCRFVAGEDAEDTSYAHYCNADLDKSTNNPQISFAGMKNTLLGGFSDTFKSSDESGVFADFIGRQPMHPKSSKSKNLSSVPHVVLPPWKGNGQCDPSGRSAQPECEPGQCCSPSGWCGNSRDYCDCQGCRKYPNTRLQDRKDSAWTSKHVMSSKKGIWSGHFGYVSVMPWVFGVEQDTTGEKHFASRVQAELVTDYGLASLSKKDPLFRQGEDYWRGKIWANLNYLMFARAGEADDLGFLRETRANFLANIERQFLSQGNFRENFDPSTGAGTGATPFTGWTAAAYALLSAGQGMDLGLGEVGKVVGEISGHGDRYGGQGGEL